MRAPGEDLTMDTGFIEDRTRFLELDDTRRRALRKVAPAVIDALPGALDRFYGVVSNTEETARHFRDSSHQAQARERQIAHWKGILEARFDDRYGEAVRRIGLAHSRLGLEPRYYLGGYAHLAADLLKAAVNASASRVPFRKGQSDEAIDALVRALFLDMELVISIYLEETEAEARRTRDALASELENGVAAIAETLEQASASLDEAASTVLAAVEKTREEAASAASGAEEAVASVKSVAAASSQIGAASGEIASQAGGQVRISTEAVEKAASAAKTINELDEAARQIGGVVGLISDVAEQTNLLALNATIEAARAGEAGKGFAVVASEVKSLAEQTAKATAEISTRIEAIQSATGAAVDAVDDIRKVIGEVSEAASAIGAAVEEQSAATNEIARNSDQAASGNQSVASAIASVEAQVSAAADAARSVSDGSAAVREHSGGISSQISQFLERLRAA